MERVIGLNVFPHQVHLVRFCGELERVGTCVPKRGSLASRGFDERDQLPLTPKRSFMLGNAHAQPLGCI